MNNEANFTYQFDRRMKWTLRIACAVIIGLGVAVIAVFGQSAKRSETTYHTFKLSDTEVGVNCRQGGTPTVRTLGSLVVVSCVR